MTRVRGKQFLLTYPHYDGTTDRIINHLRHLAGRTLQHWCVGREQHADGTAHRHVTVRYDDRIDTTNIRVFDIDGHHPNISNCKSSSSYTRATAYCQKEGDYEESPEPANIRERDRAYGLVIRSRNAVDAHAILMKEAPRDYVIFNSQINKFIDEHFTTETEYKSQYTTADFKIGPNIDLWVTKNIYLNNTSGIPLTPNEPCVSRANTRLNSLILVGQSRTGKTEYARSIGKHWYNITFYMMDAYREDCEYAVFDDIEITKHNFNLYKPFFGCQMTINITDKYRHKKQIKWGKPSIFLFNDDEFDEFTKQLTRGQRDWLKCNAEIYYVNKMY